MIDRISFNKPKEGTDRDQSPSKVGENKSSSRNDGYSRGRLEVTEGPPLRMQGGMDDSSGGFGYDPNEVNRKLEEIKKRNEETQKEFDIYIEKKNILDRINKDDFQYATDNINPNRLVATRQEVKYDNERLYTHIQDIKEYMRNPVPFYCTKAIQSLTFIYQNFQTFHKTTQKRLRNAGIPDLSNQAGPSGS